MKNDVELLLHGSSRFKPDKITILNVIKIKKGW